MEFTLKWIQTNYRGQNTPRLVSVRTPTLTLELKVTYPSLERGVVESLKLGTERSWPCLAVLTSTVLTFPSLPGNVFTTMPMGRSFLFTWLSHSVTMSPSWSLGFSFFHFLRLFFQRCRKVLTRLWTCLQCRLKRSFIKFTCSNLLGEECR